MIMNPDNTSNTKLLTSPLTKPLQLIRSSWDFYRRHWMKLSTIVLVPVFFSYMAMSFMIAEDSLALNITGIIMSIVSVVFTVAMRATMVQTVSNLHKDESYSPTIVDMYRAGFKLFWPIVGVLLLSYLVYAGGFMLFIIPGIMLSVYCYFIVFSVVLDGKRGLEAFTHSYLLIKHRWFATIWRLICIGIAVMAFYLVISGASEIIGWLIKAEKYSFESFLLGGIASFVAGLVISGYSVIFDYKLYQDMKGSAVTDTSVTAFRKILISLIAVAMVVSIAVAIIIAVYYPNTFNNKIDFKNVQEIQLIKQK